tara:strand:- start:669 stop:881 length:213 start_codon:yes stop_codon:yes gene_type:complete
MTGEEKIPVLKVWQTENGLEIQMLKASGNKYLMLGLLEEIKYNIASGNIEEEDNLDSPDYNPMTSEKYDA